MCKKTHLSCWRWLRSSSDNVRLNIPRNFWNLFLLSFHGHFRHCDRNINANIVPVDMTVCKFVYNYYIPYTHTHTTHISFTSFFILSLFFSHRWMRWLSRLTILQTKKLSKALPMIQKTFRYTTTYQRCKIH